MRRMNIQIIGRDPHAPTGLDGGIGLKNNAIRERSARYVCCRLGAVSASTDSRDTANANLQRILKHAPGS